MKYRILILVLLIAYRLPLAACFAQCEEVGFEANFEKITLDEKAIKTLGIETKKIEENAVDEIIKTTGQIEEIPANHFDVNSPVQGKVIEVLVNLGDKVNAGQSLAVLQSPEIERLQAEVTQLEAELKLAKNSYEREKSLFEQGVSAKKEFQASEASLKSTEARLDAAQNNLNLLSGSLIDSRQGTFAIKVKKKGIITERNITIGQIVDPSQILFRGADLSSVWASADIYEKDVGKVALEQKAHITLDGIPNKIFEGKITYIGSIINKETRTLPVKAILQNVAEIPLQPGAFTTLHIHTGKKKKSIVIQRTALVEIDKEETEGIHKHFVYLKKKNTFLPRQIEVAEHDLNTVEVLSGLMAGEVIVTSGAYQLQYGHGEHEKSHAVAFHGLALPLIIVIIIILFVLVFFKMKKSRLS